MIDCASSFAQAVPMLTIPEDALIVFRYPLLLFVVSFPVLALAAWIGATRFPRLRAQVAERQEDFRVIQGATLTLLGLIVGFTFSMAVGRYDQRKDYEEEEANAIGTEYARADLLPAADARKVKELLKQYLEQRLLFYTEQDHQALERVDAQTAKLQGELWAAVQAPASAQPTPLTALAVAGVNDVINTQGYTQAAWWNRIPTAAWALMSLIAICSSMLVGMGTARAWSGSPLLLIFPLIISIAFLLIADIDSPRRGVIKVAPQNLLSLSQSLRAQ
jgi:hypothetical protein